MASLLRLRRSAGLTTLAVALLRAGGVADLTAQSSETRRGAPGGRPRAPLMRPLLTTADLPSPLPSPRPGVPVGDATIASLASAAGRRDSTAARALVTALLDAGVRIQIDANTTWHPPSGAGWWTLPRPIAAGLISQYGTGKTIALVDVAGTLAKKTGADPGAVARGLLVDIRRQATGGTRDARAWARLLVELGRVGPHPYNLLEPGLAPTAVRLDVMQFALVTGRLGADFVIRAKRSADNRRGSQLEASGGDATSAGRAWGWPEPAPVAWGWSDAATATWEAAGVAASAEGAPCNFNDSEGAVLETFANVTDFGFNEGVNRLIKAARAGAGNSPSQKKLLDILEDYQGNLAMANLFLEGVKLLATLAAFQLDVEMADAPLVRTHSSRDRGQTRELRARASLNFGKVEFVNCLKPALNLKGLNFDLPNDGPVNNATTTWHILVGGASNPLATDNLFFLIPYSGVLSHVKTDDGGVARVQAVGNVQRVEMPEDAMSVERDGVVEVGVILNEPRNFASFFGGIQTQLIAGLKMGLGNPEGIGEALLDLVLRFDHLTRTQLAFTVIDWTVTEPPRFPAFQARADGAFNRAYERGATGVAWYWRHEPGHPGFELRFSTTGELSPYRRQESIVFEKNEPWEPRAGVHPISAFGKPGGLWARIDPCFTEAGVVTTTEWNCPTQSKDWVGVNGNLRIDHVYENCDLTGSFEVVLEGWLPNDTIPRTVTVRGSFLAQPFPTEQYARWLDAQRPSPPEAKFCVPSTRRSAPPRMLP
jgi:hypothetical protein